MIALDTNVLVHAHRQDAQFHAAAEATLRELAEGQTPWGIPLHCLVEFYGIVTHPGIWKTPSSPAQAIQQVEAWRESPSLSVLGDGSTTLDELGRLVQAAAVRGSKVHDARIAATCLAHGVTELWSLDRDFSRFAALKTRNPLV